MVAEETDTLIVGGGQAGIAASEHLTAAGIPHLVLEKDRVAEAWRSLRWDSLVANGPAWHDRFPNLEFSRTGPDGFPTKDEVADYLEDYAKQFDAPIRTGVEVTRAVPRRNTAGYEVTTSKGTILARNIIVATGAFQKSVIPPVVPAEEGLTQIHSSAYRNPEQLPEGGVLVIGAGSSGTQIADELNQAGRKVFLAVGPHDRPPRAYRGRDFVWWLGVLGLWDMATPPEGAEHVTIAVSGANGGRTIDFRRLASEGITLLGRSGAYADGKMAFSDNLRATLCAGDENYLSLLRAADAYVEANGLDLMPEPEAHEIMADPACVSDPILSLDLKGAGISTIIWSIGFITDYSWLEADCFDKTGQPVHARGVGKAPGVYFVGLPWQSRRGSSFIWGVWHDAKHVVEQIGIQKKYLDYNEKASATPNTQARTQDDRTHHGA